MAPFESLGTVTVRPP